MTNTGASSAGWPGRPAGVCSPKPSTWSGGIVDGMSGVQIGPGATLFTRMPREALIRRVVDEHVDLPQLADSRGDEPSPGAGRQTREAAGTGAPVER